MLTVRRRPEEWLQGFASGANDYISKPLNPPELVERVVNCLESGNRSSTDGSNPEFQLIRAAVAGKFDLVVAMYHDQGLIPVKYLGVEQGVNVTLGLPLVRTSPDHGTAFDIAGSGQADASSLAAAVRTARRLVAATS